MNQAAQGWERLRHARFQPAFYAPSVKLLSQSENGRGVVTPTRATKPPEFLHVRPRSPTTLKKIPSRPPLPRPQGD